MTTLVTKNWSDYELLDSGDGLRLERYGSFTIVRPDPNVIWKKSNPSSAFWKDPDLSFNPQLRRGEWEGNSELLKGWNIAYQGSNFCLHPTPFRHVGLFPEQASQWDWLQEKISSSKRKVRVLNLFAYTGGASIVAARAGAEVCHVDASKTSIFKAKDNAKLSELQDDAIRWIVDDADKFLKREVRRGNTYDIILMDPPVFGRGPKGEIWRLEEGLSDLVTSAKALFSENPIGFLLNFYATSLYPHSVLRLVEEIGLPFEVELGALYLEQSSEKKLLQTGFFVRS